VWVYSDNVLKDYSYLGYSQLFRRVLLAGTVVPTASSIVLEAGRANPGVGGFIHIAGRALRVAGKTVKAVGRAIPVPKRALPVIVMAIL
jgi:hypothetical protein